MKRASSVPKLDRETILSAAKLTEPHARFLVSDYYSMQDARKRADMQLRHGSDGTAEEIPSMLNLAADTFATVEAEIAKCLAKFAEGSAVGRWCLSHVGIGPVITAGVLAHLDITRAPTAGHFWRFSGLDPTCKWEKGQKRPFNPDMKQLVYFLGECFKRTSNHADSVYGKLYKTRKDELVARNERGEFAERCKTFHTKSAIVRATLATGKLPAGNLDRQAGNYAAKIFLSHLHAIMYWDHYGVAPPKPFVIQHLGHAHEIRVPNTDMFPGFENAYYGVPKRAAA